MEIAAEVAAFLDGATTSLDLAQYDFNLGETTKQIVGDAFRRAAERGVDVRFAYNVDHANPIPVPPPPEPDATLIATLPVDGKAIAGIPDLMHHKYVIRDGAVGLDRLAQLDRRFVVAAGERRRDRPLGGDREGVPDRLRPALDDGRRRAERVRRSPLGRRRAGVDDARTRRGRLDPDRQADPPGAAARPHLLAGDHDRPGARHARAGDRRQVGRSRGLRRRNADPRGGPAVAGERERLVEAAAAAARDGRPVHRQGVDALRRRHGARLHAREGDASATTRCSSGRSTSRGAASGTPRTSSRSRTPAIADRLAAFVDTVRAKYGPVVLPAVAGRRHEIRGKDGAHHRRRTRHRRRRRRPASPRKAPPSSSRTSTRPAAKETAARVRRPRRALRRDRPRAMSRRRSTPRCRRAARWTSSSPAPGSSATTCSSSSATTTGTRSSTRI